MSDIDEPHNCDDPSSCRPSLPRMKSCLKSPSHSGSATPVDSDTDDASCKKHVAFCEEGTEQVFQADEWDRTPAEIAQRLSYDDVLELKMIQRSLPRAQQTHDPLSSRPYSGVFLRNVPIPLLPLNPTTVSASASSPPPPRTGYAALDLHPNSILFTSPPKQHRKPVGTPELRPHSIAVPPPPLPPSRTTPNPIPPIPSNLPPPKRFAFIPLLDNTTASPSHDYPPSEPETSYNSDTDCSLFASDTEFSTPSLTTASLASNSPPESPTSNNPSPALEYGPADDGFILNLDVDPDVDHSCVKDSYFPRVHGSGRDRMSMLPPHPFHARRSKPVISAIPSPDLPAPSPLELHAQKPLGGPTRSMGAPRKKFTMPLVALAESPSSSSPSLGMSRMDGCEYAHLRAGSDSQRPVQGFGQGNGNVQRQKSPSRCQ